MKGTTLFTLAQLLAVTSVLAASLPSDVSLLKRALQPASDLQGTWKYYGCYSDDINRRSLDGRHYADDSMTDESCVAFCNTSGYNFAGIEYGRECYCGYGLASTATSTPNDCTSSCAGDSSEPCGGSARLSVFTSGQQGPVTNPGPNGWQSLGCYTDSVSARTLSRLTSTPGGSSQLTVAQCTSTCQAAGFFYSGVEYSGECFCGNSVDNGAQLQTGTPSQTGCDKTCNGDGAEFCGGADRINLYHLPTTPPADWQDLGCYVDSASARILGVGTSVPGDYNNLTVENCLGACQAAGYQLAGVEYARECYCDNAFQHDAARAPYSAEQGGYGCNSPCTGDSKEICGGGNRLNAYKYTGSKSSTTKTSTATTTLAVTTLSTVTTTTTTTMTTTTTTTAVTTTPTTTAAATSASTVTTTATTTTTTSSNAFVTNRISNPSFEYGTGTSDAPPWSWGPNNNNGVGQGQLYGTFDSGSYALAGNRYAALHESSYGDSGTRSLCLSQTISLLPGNYQLSFSVGRISVPPPGSTTSTDHIYYAVYFGASPGTLIQGGSVCGAGGDTCPVKAQNGVNAYQTLTLGVVVADASGAGGYVSQTLSVCGTYVDSRRGQEDVMLLDAFSLYGPL